MGNCFSSSPEETDFQASFRRGSVELANMPAGRRGPADDYTFLHYCLRVQNLLSASRTVLDNYEDLRAKFDFNRPINNEIMHLRQALRILRTEYELFFRDSSWDIDANVDVRKKIGAEAFFKIPNIREMVCAIDEKTSSQAFRELELALRDQVRAAAKISIDLDANKRFRSGQGQKSENVEEVVTEDTCL